ncbi:MAG: 4'-phosphopantetheinyl transferase superfamily protein [Acinetobacter sp.]
MANIDIYFQQLARFIPVLHEDNLSRTSFKKHQQFHIEHVRHRLLAKVLQLQPSQLEIARSEYGKPYLKNVPQLEFNHSHSREHYALAISQTMTDIGIDVESLQRKVRFQALAEHAFHPHELEKWQQSGDSIEYWFRVWTAKEAILKACGLGIRMSLNELDTNIDIHQWQGRCQHSELGNFCYHQEIRDGAILSLAWRETVQFPQIQFHSI